MNLDPDALLAREHRRSGTSLTMLHLSARRLCWIEYRANLDLIRPCLTSDLLATLNLALTLSLLSERPSKDFRALWMRTENERKPPFIHDGICDVLIFIRSTLSTVVLSW